VTIRRTLSETKARTFIQEPKTRPSRRTVTLPAFAPEALSQNKGAGRTATGLRMLTGRGAGLPL
jgi:hypothetical protein